MERREPQAVNRCIGEELTGVQWGRMGKTSENRVRGLDQEPR
jgi:hypothetical protein